MLLGIFNFFAMIPSCISENSRQGLPPVFEELHPVFEPVFPPTDAGFAASFPKTCGRVTFLPEDWRRVTRTFNGETFVSIYDGNDESHEYLLENGKDRDDKDGRGGRDDRDDKDEHGNKCPSSNDHKPSLSLVREFIGGPGTDDLEATKYHGRSLNLLKDALGSTIALTNRGGNPVAKIGYDAWGNLRFPDKPGYGTPPCGEKDLDGYLDRCDGSRAFESSGFNPHHLGRHQGKTLTPYLYTGRRFDGFSQFYNNRNRMYNPAVGRFVSKDPVGFGGGKNLWGYVENNPLTKIDPMGLWDIIVHDDTNDAYQYMASKLRWRLNSDIALINANSYSSANAIFNILSSYSNMDRINRLFFIGHGGKGAFYSGGSAIIRVSNILSAAGLSSPFTCSPDFSVVFRPEGFTFFYSCNSGDPSTSGVSLAQAWGQATKAHSAGVRGRTLYHSSGFQMYDLNFPYYDTDPPSFPYFEYLYYTSEGKRYTSVLNYYMYGRQVVRY